MNLLPLLHFSTIVYFPDCVLSLLNDDNEPWISISSFRPCSPTTFHERWEMDFTYAPQIFCSTRMIFRPPLSIKMASIDTHTAIHKVEIKCPYRGLRAYQFLLSIESCVIHQVLTVALWVWYQHYLRRTSRESLGNDKLVDSVKKLWRIRGLNYIHDRLFSFRGTSPPSDCKEEGGNRLQGWR